MTPFEYSKDDVIKDYFASFVVAWPESTMMDGVIYYDENKKGLFVPGSVINKAITFAYSMRTGFIRENYCYSLPDWKIEEIHRDEFRRMLQHLLELNPPLPCPLEWEWYPPVTEKEN